QNAAFDPFHPILEMHVAGLRLGPCIYDGDDRTTFPVDRIVSHLHGARAMPERTLVIGQHPARRTQITIGFSGHFIPSRSKHIPKARSGFREKYKCLKASGRSCHTPLIRCTAAPATEVPARNTPPDRGAATKAASGTCRCEVMARSVRSGPQKQGIVGAGTGTGSFSSRLPSRSKRFRTPADTPALQ